MQNKKGFSLIESLIYCFILMFLILISSAFITKSIMHLKESRLAMQTIINIYACADSMTHDIYEWDAAKEYVIKNTQCVFNTKNYSISWHYDDKKIYRTVGQFDFKKNYWIEKSSALVANHINLCEFFFNKKNDQLFQIIIKLKGMSTMLTKKIILMNRTI